MVQKDGLWWIKQQWVFYYPVPISKTIICLTTTEIVMFLGFGNNGVLKETSCAIRSASKDGTVYNHYPRFSALRQIVLSQTIFVHNLRLPERGWLIYWLKAPNKSCRYSISNLKANMRWRMSVISVPSKMFKSFRIWICVVQNQLERRVFSSTSAPNLCTLCRSRRTILILFVYIISKSFLRNELSQGSALNFSYVELTYINKLTHSCNLIVHSFLFCHKESVCN